LSDVTFPPRVAEVIPTDEYVGVVTVGGTGGGNALIATTDIALYAFPEFSVME
jgi:hypothetical protein